MTSKQLLSKLKHDKAYTEYLNVLEKDLETLDLVWLWLHNYKLEKSGLDQIKEWFDNDK